MTKNNINSNFNQIATTDANGNVTGITANVANVKIGGGANGQVLSTTGSNGNLVWQTLGNISTANFNNNTSQWLDGTGAWSSPTRLQTITNTGFTLTGAITAGTNLGSISANATGVIKSGAQILFAGDPAGAVVYTVQSATFVGGLTDFTLVTNVSQTIPSGSAIQQPTLAPWTQVVAGNNTTLSVANGILTVNANAANIGFANSNSITFTTASNTTTFSVVDSYVANIATGNASYAYRSDITYPSTTLLNNPVGRFMGASDASRTVTANLIVPSNSQDGAVTNGWQLANVSTSTLSGGTYSFQISDPMVVFAQNGVFNITETQFGAGNIVAGGELNLRAGTTLPAGTYPVYVAYQVNLSPGLQAVTQSGGNTTNNVSFTGSNVSLGAVGNLHITGGSNNQVLTTDGNGNLSWTDNTITGLGWIVPVGFGYDLTPGTYVGWSSNTSLFPVFYANGQVLPTSGFTSNTYLGATRNWSTDLRQDTQVVADLYQQWHNSISGALTVSTTVLDDVGRFQIATSPLPVGAVPTQSDSVVQNLWTLTNPNAAAEFVNSSSYDNGGGAYYYQRGVAGAIGFTENLQQVLESGNVANIPITLTGSARLTTPKVVTPAIENSGGNINISTSGANTWTFTSNGALQLAVGDSLFHEAVDTGLNIRSANIGANANIYMYTFGSDGNGTGGGEVDVLVDRVRIFSNWNAVPANSTVWEFLPDGRTAFPQFTLPNTAGTAGQVLKSDGLGNVFWQADTPGNAAGSNTQIQFNSGGGFGASANLTFDGNNLTVNSSIVTDNINGLTGGNTALALTAGGNIGQIHLGAGNIRVGKNNVDAYIATNGGSNLVLQTNEGNSTGGQITLRNGTSGNVDIQTGGGGFVNVPVLNASNVIATDVQSTGNMTANNFTANNNFIGVRANLTGNLTAGNVIANSGISGGNLSISGLTGTGNLLIGNVSDIGNTVTVTPRNVNGNYQLHYGASNVQEFRFATSNTTPILTLGYSANASTGILTTNGIQLRGGTTGRILPALAGGATVGNIQIESAGSGNVILNGNVTIGTTAGTAALFAANAATGTVALTEGVAGSVLTSAGVGRTPYWTIGQRNYSVVRLLNDTTLTGGLSISPTLTMDTNQNFLNLSTSTNSVTGLVSTGLYKITINSRISGSSGASNVWCDFITTNGITSNPAYNTGAVAYHANPGIADNQTVMGSGFLTGSNVAYMISYASVTTNQLTSGTFVIVERVA